MDPQKVIILYSKYYDFAKEAFIIGGVETYITDLIKLCKNLNLSVTVYQIGSDTRSKEFDDFTVQQIQTKHADFQKFADKIKQLINDQDVLAIYMTDTMVPRHNPFKKSIAIQHGISWDIPSNKKRSILHEILSNLRINSIQRRRVNNVDVVVCVDFNFINWYRTQNHTANHKLKSVLNYTRILKPIKKPAEVINIIFARRLVRYRGTRVFTEAIIPLLKEYKNIKVTIAGEGYDEQYMRSKLESYPNVDFIKYQSLESLKIHADKHIAVVPTVGSEGTSLSLLEAMSSQCAVIASNVGGITNIVLDGYNGLIVDAGDIDELYKALKKLIENPELVQKLSINGYETVKQVFSIERWENQWREIISTQLKQL